MSNDRFIAMVQAILSILYLVATFVIILIFELGRARLSSPGAEKTFDGMVNWMTGGALIVLYFWLQRAKAASIPDPTQTSVEQTTVVKTTPTPPTTPNGDPNEITPPTLPPAVGAPNA